MWQAGLLNGVGGKVEPGESFGDAALREFREETGVNLENQKVYPFLKMVDEDMELVAFTTNIDSRELFESAKSTTDEQVVVVRDAERMIFPQPRVPNLKWIIPLAIDFYREYKMTTVDYAFFKE